ncbi:hypothetical protein [Desulfurivibrio dismutans]|uniref:hypothetical protein n=1 Tax=Desulfurivibrio dismutans TaxID=1398908 RepID=UPI0023DACBDF|nr:hypothetical protein [Desulfurivibrio alkaliphilus]MDF1615234.1 hypothetical protein [Desulfurivibrio alkaliphilus]
MFDEAGSSGERSALFVSGFRWSGSGAVVDWLRSHRGAVLPGDGEIFAINYGVMGLLQLAEGKRWHGERLARLAMCPERRLWGDVFGPWLAGKGRAGRTLARWADLVFMAAALVLTADRVRWYDADLSRQLRRNYRGDAEYLRRLGDYAACLREVKGGGDDLAAEPRVQLAASRLIALFYDRWRAEDGRLPIFDNALSGREPEYLALLHREIFPRQLILLVRRDPRDQFADLVRYSRSTWSWNVRRFIRDYRRRHRQAQAVMGRCAGANRRFRLFSFEDFVMDRGGLRSELTAEVESFLAVAGMAGDWGPGPFVVAESACNIGIWKKSGMRQAMALITKELPEFLVAEAD